MASVLDGTAVDAMVAEQKGFHLEHRVCTEIKVTVEQCFSASILPNLNGSLTFSASSHLPLRTQTGAQD